ncbi:uncharacterized protein PHALS_08886 [Plasmopara halstedii]|uniref:Uncharacterized protein n=1 Tax=Plasmopara halstedii TaxID=4781 RepID=A0A0N7L4J3_PLAHL|nr:uncharacterized protein PHALS_08886 [Plasmopara halstedii]CEG38835.1 hypothetical protein PHALS_08886 [Plasmopara halstedii]|eukprot:XP_024575204.1 hypothetical protein PHALS_08886 [Plasmopara halstedii]
MSYDSAMSYLITKLGPDIRSAICTKLLQEWSFEGCVSKTTDDPEDRSFEVHVPQ